MKYRTWWIDRWVEMGIGDVSDARLPHYTADIISMPYDEIEGNCWLWLWFCYRGGERLHYPEQQALPMIELMQVGI